MRIVCSVCRAGVPGTPQERPFEYYNPKATMGIQPPSARGLDAEPGYGIDSRSIGRAAPPPPYVDRDLDDLPMSRGAPPNVSHGRGAPVEPGRGTSFNPILMSFGHQDSLDFVVERRVLL